MIVRLKVACADRKGLVSALAARLFDLGINLGDTSFATFGQTAEFTALMELPPDLGPDALVSDLDHLAVLGGAEIEATPVTPGKPRPDAVLLTHRITCLGPDQPGLLARLTEVLVSHDANIASLHATQFDHPRGELYRIRLAVSVAAERAESCLSALANAAQQLGQTLTAEPAKHASLIADSKTAGTGAG